MNTSQWMNKRSIKRRRRDLFRPFQDHTKYILVLHYDVITELGRWLIPETEVTTKHRDIMNGANGKDFDEDGEEFNVLGLHWRLEEKGDYGETKDLMAFQLGAEYAEMILPKEEEGLWHKYELTPSLDLKGKTIVKTVMTTYTRLVSNSDELDSA